MELNNNNKLLYEQLTYSKLEAAKLKEENTKLGEIII